MKITVKYIKTYSFMVTINPNNYVSDCRACNCLRYCYRHKHGVSVIPNMAYIAEHAS